MTSLRPVAALGALLLATAGAAAHEFTVALIAPETSVTQVRNGFLLASSERDGHPNETSEGHLGGLDAQLEIVTPGAAVPESDIVVAIAPATLPARDNGAWAFSVGDLPLCRRAEFIETSDFTRRYQIRYGAPPDMAARRSYAAARVIDLAVRATGRADDAAALAAAVSAC